ncbi:hypothetical protein [Streptomyces virginiae]
MTMRIFDLPGTSGGQNKPLHEADVDLSGPLAECHVTVAGR